MKDNHMDKTILGATMSAREEMDRFIFETIGPFCEGVIHQTISKEALVAALTRYDRTEAERDAFKAKCDAAVRDIYIATPCAICRNACSAAEKLAQRVNYEGCKYFEWRHAQEAEK